MKRKLISMLFVLTCIFVLNPNNVFATSGALRKNSIKTCANGITYGLHGDGAGGTHWHQAEARAEMSSGWAAVGDSILNDPCPKNDNNTNQNNNSNSNQSNNTIKENNTSSNHNQTNSSTNIEKKKSNDTTISQLTINGKNFYSISDTMEHTVQTNNVDIKVETKDKNAKYEIQGNVDKLSKENVNEIKILVTAEDGTTKTYILNITREIKESYVRITSLNVNGNSIYFGLETTKELSLSNSDDKLNIEYKLSNTNANMFITLNGKEVKNGDYIEVGKNNYLLTISDEDGNEYSYELIIERMTKSDETISFILGLVTLGGIGYLIYYFAIKKKKNRN